MGEFTLKRITMTLDPQSIQNAIDEIKELDLNLKYALDALCEWLLKDGVMIAKMNLRSYFTKGSGAGNRSGLLSRSIRYEMANGKSGRGYLIAGYPGDHMSDNPAWANYSYAVFFEFGFGTSSNYLEDNTLLTTENQIHDAYNAGKISRSTGRTRRHPSDRDVYRRTKDFKIRESSSGTKFFGWVYKDAETGKFYVSQGQNPKPFMYQTMLDLAKRAEEEGGKKLQQFIVEYTP